MFKSGRWRGGGKAKAVFKLQFHATQVPELGWDSMMVVVTPHDVGRPTARSEGAEVVDGACRWVTPIFEATKFPPGKTAADKIYQFLVYETGSSKAALLGEATVNLAEYADVFKPSAVTLPLKGSPAPGALLHVTIQRVVGGGGGGGCREDGSENGDAATTPLRRTLQSQLSGCEDENSDKAREAAGEMNHVQDGLVISKPPGMRFLSRRNMPVSVDPGGHLHNSKSYDAVSLSGSDGSPGRFTSKNSAGMHNTFLQDATHVLSPFAGNGVPRNPLSSGDWSGSSAPDASTDGSTSNSGETGLGGADDDVEKLRSEIANLTRKLDVSDMELQTLRKQIVKESRRGQDLSKETSSLREERDALRRECEGLRGVKKTIHDANGSGKRLSDGEDPWSQIDELKQELGHEKNLNTDLRVQLQKMQESNSEMLLAVRDLEEMLEEKNREVSILQEGTLEDPQEAAYEHALSYVHSAGHKMDLSETSSYHEKEDELMLDALVKKTDGITTSELEQKIVELSDEIKLYKRDREDLEMQMEQLALDYEILKQENHDISSRLEQTQLREQLRMQYECSAHLSIISDLEANVENLETELQEQTKRLEADMVEVMDSKIEQEQRAIKAEESVRKARWNSKVENLETELQEQTKKRLEAEIVEVLAAKVEQEQRAIKAEESLRKVRWNNASTAERLQEEFKSLSSQVSSAFSANEWLLVQARKEATELQIQKSQLEEVLQNAQEDLEAVQEQHRVKIQQLLTLVDFKSKETDKLVMELKTKSEEFQNQKRYDEAKIKALLEEIELLKVRIDKLSDEKEKLLENNEQKDMELAANDEKGTLLQNKTAEIALLNKELALLKDQVQTYLEDLHNLKRSKLEKEEMIGKLQIDIGSLKIQHDNTKKLLSTKESEKSNLASQVLKLRRALESREGVKENGVSSEATDGHNTNSKRSKHSTSTMGSNDEPPSTNGHNVNHDCNGHVMREDGAHVDQPVEELDSLKELNKAMLQELKELHERYSEISLKFAEVEGERQQLVMTVRTLKNSLR